MAAGRRERLDEWSWVLIASITGVMIVIGVYGMVAVAADLFMPVLVPPLPSPLPRLRLGAGPGGAEGLEVLREVLEVWQCSTLIGVAGCLMDCRLCSAQGIGRRHYLRCVPLATYSSKCPKRDAHDVTSYL